MLRRQRHRHLGDGVDGNAVGRGRIADRRLVRSLVDAERADAAIRLAQSQASWTSFAGDTCDYVKAANPQRMIPDDAWMNCLVDFSDARVRILKKWEAQLDASP